MADAVNLLLVLVTCINFSFVHQFFFNIQIVTTNSPNVEGMTAIAAWMITCILFVFLALVAYAWLLWKKKKSCLKRKRARKMSDDEGKARNKMKEDYRSRLDDIFFVVFPTMFFIFNLIYWPMCLRGHEDALED